MDSEPTPKQEKNAHSKIYNPPRVNTGGALRVKTVITASNKNNDTNSPEKPTPDPSMDSTISPIPMTPQNDRRRE